MDQADETLTFHYLKTPACKEVLMDGVYGGVNAQTGRFWMAAFAERAPLPKEVVISIQNGQVDATAKPASIDSKQGIIRSVEAVLHFEIGTAVALHQWLGEKIAAFAKENPDVIVKDVENGAG